MIDEDSDDEDALMRKQRKVELVYRELMPLIYQCEEEHDISKATMQYCLSVTVLNHLVSVSPIEILEITLRIIDPDVKQQVELLFERLKTVLTERECDELEGKMVLGKLLECLTSGIGNEFTSQALSEYIARKSQG